MAGAARPRAGSVSGSPACPTTETTAVRDLLESILRAQGKPGNFPKHMTIVESCINLSWAVKYLLILGGISVAQNYNIFCDIRTIPGYYQLIDTQCQALDVN